MGEAVVRVQVDTISKALRIVQTRIDCHLLLLAAGTVAVP
jgi:hypothetical protein